MVTELSKGSSIASLNPATKELLGSVPVTSPDDIVAITKRARNASESWRKLSIHERLEYVKRFRDLLSDGMNSVSKLITEEAGKPFTEALGSEVFGVLETCQWLESRAEGLLDAKDVSLNPVFFTGKRSYNLYQPLGVIAVISPWNYPFSIPATSILLALVAGNGVVVKPSPKTPLVAEALVGLVEKAGFPPGLVGLVQGDRLECERLIQSGVNRIVFTGSVQGGRALMGLAAPHLIPLTLELGGKHPAIVLPDVDVNAAASGIVWSAFTNGGQACASIDRLYLLKPVPNGFVESIVQRASNLRLGNPMDPTTEVGPLIDELQVKRIEELVSDAVSKGASILCGGKSRPELGGFHFEPTVLTNLTDDMRILQEEIFGPLLPIVQVDSEAEALAKANSCELGLASSIWTADIQHGEKLAEQLQAGIVWLNDGLFSHACPDAPWGGIKNSGFGKAHSEYELLDMVCIKNVSVSGQGLRDWHYPYSESAREYIKAGMNLLHKRSIADKMQALMDVLSLKPKLKK